jgi:hypothetical protein
VHFPHEFERNPQRTLHALCSTSYIGGLLQYRQHTLSLACRDKFGRSAIFCCVFGMLHVSVKNAQALIEINPSIVDEIDNFGKSPLYYALLLEKSEELLNVLCEASSHKTVAMAFIDYLWDSSEYSIDHLKASFKLEDPLYNVPYWARPRFLVRQTGGGRGIQRSPVLKAMCAKYAIDDSRPDPVVISGLFNKLSMDTGLTEPQKRKLMNVKLRGVFDYYARRIDPGCHEMLNTATTQSFALAVALDEHPKMERTAKHVDRSSSLTINNLVERQRMKTHEYLMKPVQVKALSAENQKHFKTDKEKYVFHGHVKAGFYCGGGGCRDIVTTAGASRGTMHTAQTQAMDDSRHHLSLSRRLSKVTDKFQAGGEDFLKAFDDKGFHEDSYMRVDGGSKRNVTSPAEAYTLAVCAQFNFQKRRTNEKKIREDYLDTGSVSEEYDEIDSADEVDSSDSLSSFEKRISATRCFRDFKAKYSI